MNYTPGDWFSNQWRRRGLRGRCVGGRGAGGRSMIASTTRAFFGVATFPPHPPPSSAPSPPSSAACGRHLPLKGKARRGRLFAASGGPQPHRFHSSRLAPPAGRGFAEQTFLSRFPGHAPASAKRSAGRYAGIQGNRASSMKWREHHFIDCATRALSSRNSIPPQL